MAAAPETDGIARYIFGVEFRLAPGVEGLTVDPGQFTATVYRQADPPGEDGWLFFRDHLWRGELADARHFVDLLSEGLDVPVLDATFRELQTDEVYLTALKEATSANLGEFRADSVDQALSKYLGSSIRVVEADGQFDEA